MHQFILMASVTDNLIPNEWGTFAKKKKKNVASKQTEP